MKICDLLEKVQIEYVRGPRGTTEVLMNPSTRDVLKELHNQGDLRGYWEPVMGSYAFWPGSTLHEEVIGNDPIFFEYEDVIKLYLSRSNFGIYHFENRKRTSEEVYELAGGSREELLKNMASSSHVLKNLIKSKEVVWDDE
jgi:hypothetical protein